MDTIYIFAFSQNENTPKPHPLPFTKAGTRCFVGLRNPRGATSIHVLLKTDTDIEYRAEIPTFGDEQLQIEVILDENSKLFVQSSRTLYALQKTPALAPLEQLIDPQTYKKSIELALVIDGTIRITPPNNDGTLPLLLMNKERWAEHVDQLYQFIETLREHYQEFKLSIVAFGDQKMPNVMAYDLDRQIAYRIYPEESERRMLRAVSLPKLKDYLLSISATSGGDFVDALADALNACNQLRWSPTARKLVLISGDSPGFSLHHPIPKGADICVRENDVDIEVFRLHRLGVEVSTVYHPLERDFLNKLLEPQRLLQLSAQEQYLRLASLPEMAYSADQFDGKNVADEIWQMSSLIARESTYGELIEISDEFD